MITKQDRQNFMEGFWWTAQLTFIAVIHIGLLLCPVGVHASTITIQVGQHLPVATRDEVALSPLDTDSPLDMTSTSLYTEGDWLDHPILASIGTATTDFTLVYDGKIATPEITTWWMTLLGLESLLMLAQLRIDQSRRAKAISVRYFPDA